ncbi:MAG: septum site-determining protein MinD [Anaerolineae bacterium]
MGGRIITITSGKGGVGKTTTTANIGVGLALLGKSVVCVDTDIGLRNLDLVMGLDNRIVYDLVDVVEGRCRLKQALVRDRHLSELYLLPAAQTRDKTAVSAAQMQALCDELRKEFDFILLDSPAGIETGFHNALAPADEVIIVTTPDVSAVRDADRAIGFVEAQEKGPARLIINRIKSDLVRKGEMLTIEDVVELLAIELIGIVPEDEAIIMSTNRGTPAALERRSLAGQAFRNIAKRLTGQEVPFMPLPSDDGWLKRLTRLVRPTSS